MAPPRFRFPASRRLKETREFARVRTEGRTTRGAMMLLGALEVEEASGFRVGLVTSKRVGGAVLRNRLRRRLREIVRRHQRDLRANVWLVVVTRPAAARATSAELEAEWLKLARRAGVLSSSSARISE